MKADKAVAEDSTCSRSYRRSRLSDLQQIRSSPRDGEPMQPMPTMTSPEPSGEIAFGRRADLLALVASRTTNAVVITDPHGHIEWVNAGFERLTGYCLDEVRGRKPGSFLQGPETDPDVIAMMRQRLEAGEGFHSEIVNYSKNGIPYWLSIEVQPVRDDAGQLLHFVAIETDITEQKQMEHQLRESRERFELAVKGSNDGLWDWNICTGMVFYSPRWMEQLGYEPDELPPTVETFDQLLHPADADRVWGDIESAHMGVTKEYSSEFRMRHKDGGWRWILSRGVVVMDENGDAIRMAGCHTDVTPQKRSAEALRQAEEKYRCIFENSTMGIFQTTPQGRYLSVNTALARIYGYESVEDLLASVTSIRRQVYVDPERRPQFVEAVESAGEVADFESEIYRKDGSVIWISENARVVRDESGAVAYYEGTIQDITRRKTAEAGLLKAMEEADAARAAAEQIRAAAERAREEAERAREDAERANRAKSQFLANMSHEIRTPLNGVIGMAELLLRRGGLNDQQLRYAQVIQSSANSLLSLINDVLDFSKIEAGKMELSTVETDVRTVVEDVAEMLAPRASGKGIEFLSQVSSVVPARLMADPDRLRQILVNLANNAIKFTEHGEVVVRVTCEQKPDREGRRTVRFSVTDTGVGIPADRMDRLFKSFSQVDASDTRKYGGTGLGLAIAKQLSELMGGTIGVESRVGEGSTFWFTARLAEVRSSHATARHLHANTAARIKGARILAVDDNPVYREILKEQFAGWGLAVTLAGNGNEALDQLRQAAQTGKPFDVAVVDMVMPGMNGAELAKQVVADPVVSTTPLLMLTSLDNPFDPEQMRKAGFRAFLTKPVRQSQLFDAVVDALAADLPATGSESSTEQATVGSTQASPLKGLRVLLAEDNEINQEVACELLRGYGCEVEVANNGQRALLAVTQKRFDVVLMDCQMPELDGFEATRGIRQLERAGRQFCDAGRLPIIALTANAIEGDRQRCLAAGMDGYVTKPVDPDLLEKALRQTVRRSAPSPDSRAVVEPKPTPARAPETDSAAPHPSAALPSTPAHSSSGAAPSMDSAELPVDLPSLMNRCRGKGPLVEKLLSKLAEQLPQQLDAIRRTVEQNDLSSLAKLAHAVKGSAANLSADPLKRAAAELERAGSTRDEASVEALMNAFAGELQRCLDYLPRAAARARQAPGTD